MSCEHLSSLTAETLIPKSNFPLFRCQECLKVGGQWVHLRICQSCGSMLCCDSSKYQHARRHYEETGHPVVSSAELGEQWIWCYPDEVGQNY